MQQKYERAAQEEVLEFQAGKKLVDQGLLDIHQRNNDLTEQYSLLLTLYEEKEQMVSDLSDAVLVMEEDLKAARTQSSGSSVDSLKEYMKKNRQLSAQLAKQRAATYKAKQEAKQFQTELGECLQTLEAYEGGGILMVKPETAAAAAQSTLHPKREAAQKKKAGKFGPGFQSDDEDPDKKNWRYWKAKYQKAANKRVESRTQVGALSSELKRTRALLQRELGDNVDLDKLVSGEDQTYRTSRREETSILKSKIRTLKKRLDEQQGYTGGGGETYRETRQEAHLSALKQDRSRQLDELLDYRDRAESALAKLKSRGDAAKARIRTLEGQNRDFKANLNVMLDAKAGDDELIHELHKELQKQQHRLHSLDAAFSKHNEQQQSNLGEQNQRQKNELKHLEAELAQVRMAKRWEQDEIVQKNELLEMDLHARTELTERLEVQVKKLSRQVNALTTTKVELEAKLDAGARKGGRPGKSETASLKLRLRKAQAAVRELKTTYAEQLQGKEETLRVLNDLLKQQKVGYQSSVENLRRQFKIVHAEQLQQQ
jgi:chromosome segregation ATPase